MGQVVFVQHTWEQSDPSGAKRKARLVERADAAKAAREAAAEAAALAAQGDLLLSTAGQLSRPGLNTDHPNSALSPPRGSATGGSLTSAFATTLGPSTGPSVGMSSVDSSTSNIDPVGMMEAALEERPVVRRGYFLDEIARVQNRLLSSH